MIDLNIGPVPGQKGQTKSSWRSETSLRGVLLKLVHDNPDVDDETLAELFLAKVAAPWQAELVPDLLKAAARYAFDNHLLQIRKKARKPRRQPTEAEAAAAKAKIDTIVETVKQTVFLDLVEPNGKALGDCTAGEARAFGGWRIALADRIGDDTAIIREKIGEADAASIFASSTSK